MKKVIVAIALFVLAISTSAFAHSGGTNSQGCHTNHRTGDYHCHNPKP